MPKTAHLSPIVFLSYPELDRQTTLSQTPGNGYKQACLLSQQVGAHQLEWGCVMSVLDIVALVIVVLFVLGGIFRGLKLTWLWLASLLLSFVAALIAPRLLTNFVATHFGLPRIAAAIETAFAAMFIVSTLFAIKRWKVRQEQKSEAKAEKMVFKTGKSVISIKNRILGGFIGCISGMIMVAFVGWVYDAAAASPLGRFVPDASNSPTARLSENVMTRAFALGTVLATRDVGTARFAGAVLSRPTRTVAGVNTLLANPDIKELTRNPAFLGAFYSGDAAGIAKVPSLGRFLNNMDNKKLLLSMGVMPSGGVVEIPKGLAKAGKLLSDLVNNPELTGALQGLQKDGLFDEGKALELVMDKRFQAIVESMINGGAPSAPAGATPAPAATAPAAGKKTAPPAPAKK